VALATKVVLIIEYDGTRYHGFQLQAELPTIQGELEEALSKLTGREHRVMAASRTDAGVHSRGQVVSFRTGSRLPLQTFVSGLNHYLPRDIAVKAVYRVDDFFSVRRDAVSREYCYNILNSPTRSPIRRRYSYRVPGRLDIRAMNEAGEALVGKHDFASFASRIEVRGKSMVRNVFRARVEREEKLVVFNMVANSFLAHQVRNTVGVLLEVGAGKINVDEVRRIMEARKPGLAGPTVPACGLQLMRINYPVPFEEMQ